MYGTPDDLVWNTRNHMLFYQTILDLAQDLLRAKSTERFWLHKT